MPPSPISVHRRRSSTSKSSSSTSSGEVFEQAANKKYRLKVTAGSGYDVATHQCVPVNGEHTVRIESELATVSLSVRIKDYNGMYLGIRRERERERERDVKVEL